MSDKILIFDGTNCFLRNYAVNPTMDSNGNSIGGLFGTIRSVKSMIREVDASRVYFVWDAKGGSRRRRGIFSDYKAGRKPRLNREFEAGTVQDEKENISWQMEKTREFLGYLGVTQIQVEDIEADDAIGYLVGYLDPHPKVLVSSDRDMWQLVSDTTIVYWPAKKSFINTGNFLAEASCLPQNYVLMRAMRGSSDAADNIHGIKGLGDKTILKLFPELAKRPFTLDDLAEECRAIIEQQGPNPKGKFRWYRVVLDNLELVSKNVQLMQLTSPIISAKSATIIRGLTDSRPTFQFTSFKLALLNNGIQLTDSDLMTTFKTLQARTTHASP